MIAKIIGALVVLAIVGYFMVSLGMKGEEAQQSAAVSQLQKQMQEQRAQVEGLEGVEGAPQAEPPAQTDTQQ